MLRVRSRRRCSTRPPQRELAPTAAWFSPRGLQISEVVTSPASPISRRFQRLSGFDALIQSTGAARTGNKAYRMVLKSWDAVRRRVGSRSVSCYDAIQMTSICLRESWEGNRWVGLGLQQ